MSIHELIKNTMTEHKNKIELFQWAVISSVTSLVYSEYLANMKQKQIPVKRIMIAPIKYVSELLNRDGDFMKLLSEELIDGMISNPLFQKYKNAPEFEIFNETNIEVIKTIFDLYIIPNIERRIPESIYIKFNLGDESQQLFTEDNTIDLFDRKLLTDGQFQYIIEETVLQLLFTIPTMKKNVEPIENNQRIWITNDEVMVIDHNNALTPIHINKTIIDNKDVMTLLKFITSTTIEKMEYGDYGTTKGPNNDLVEYTASTNIFNQVVVVDYIGIDV